MAREITITAPQISGSGEVFYGRELWDRQDYNSAMRSGKALEIYEQMRSTDGEVAGGLARLTAPLLSANWVVDAPGGEDAEKHEPTLLCRRAIFGEDVVDPFSDSWAHRLRHALLMVAFGFSVSEKIWGIDSEGYQSIVRMAPIMPATVFKFTFNDDGTLKSMTQRAWVLSSGTYETVEIPAAKLMVFAFGREGNNLFGRSVLRSAWRNWHYKNALVEVDGIRHERWGTGIPWVEIPENANIGPEEKQDIQDLTKNLRTHEHQAVFLVAGRKLHIDYPSGTQSDIVGSLNYHDQQISRSLITEYMATGTAETGSRAVVTSKIDQMMLAIQGTATGVEETYNRQFIPEVVDRNFGKQKNGYPRLHCEDLDKMSGTQKAEIIKLLAAAGFMKPDKRIRAQLRKELDFPEEDDATLEDVPAMVAAAQGGVPDGGSTPASAKGAEPDEAHRTPAADTPSKVVKPEKRPAFMGSEVVPIGSPVSLSRDPMPHECFCAFTEMKAYLRDEPQRIWHRVVEPYRKRLALRIAAKVPGMPDQKLAARDLGAMPGVRGPFEDDMAAALLKVYMRGRVTVLEERKRQLAGVASAPATVTLQEDVSQDDEFDIAPTKEQKAWVATLATGFVGALVTAMVNEASRAGLAARQAEVSAREQEAQVLAAVNALSEARQQAELTGSVTRTFGTGRDEQAQEMQSEIVTEYYSAIMDSDTCESCAAFDGMEQSPGDDKFITPNPDCDGAPGGNCRCLTVYAWKEAAA